MYVRFYLHVKDKNKILNWSYKYPMYCMIKELFSDADITDNMLSFGKYKMYTFSDLYIPHRCSVDKGLLIKSNVVWFDFASIDESICKSLIYAISQRKNIKIANLMFVPVGYSILDNKIVDDIVVFKTVSPVVIRSTKLVSGRQRCWELSVDDDEYKSRLLDNLVSRFETYYGTKINRGNIDILKIYNVKEKGIMIKNTFIRCAHYYIVIKAPREILQFISEMGLGEKNGMGFGMVRVVA